jgi:ATP-dependent protease ClpP protease subunit
MTKTINKEDDIFPNLLSREFDFIRTVSQEVKRHDVFLDTEISEPSNYRDLISILFNAGENDVINIFINSPGGHLNSALSIIEGIKHSDSTVTGIIMGDCYSAASMIALNCHNIVVLDSANMMIHTASFGATGNTGNVKAYTDFTVKEIEKLLVSTYEGFLSKDEIDKIKTGVEIWLSAEDISKRMETRAKHLEAKTAKVVAAAEKPVKRTRTRR